VKAIVYARQSQARPGERDASESLSLEAQEAAIRRYCAERGWSVVRVIRDHDLSGERWDRPGMRDLLDAAEAGIAEAVVVWKLSRFARDVLYQEITHRELKQRGVALYSVTESGIEKTLIRVVHGAMAQQQNEDLREHISSALEARAKRGLHHGRPPFGYVTSGTRETGRRLELVPDEAAVVQRIYRLRADGLGVPAIADALNADGLRTRQGIPWHDTSIRKILQCATYTGLAVYRGAIVGELAPGVVEPIIARPLWEQVQRSFDGKRHMRNHGQASWLEGLVRHGCGSGMGIGAAGSPHPTGDGKRLSFRCNTAYKVLAYRCEQRPVSLNVAAMEAAARECLLTDLRTRPADPAKLVQARADALGRSDAVRKRASLIKQKTSLIEQVRRAEDLYETGRRDRAWFDARDDALQRQLATVTAELDDLTDLPNEDDLADRLAEIARLMPAVTLLELRPDAMRATLAALGQVVFDGGVVSIQYAPRYRDVFPAPCRVRAVYRRSFLNAGEWAIERVV
jgi:site-specific DNA recombinase